MTDKIEWEIDVIYQIELQGEMTTSDAQGLMEAQPFEIAQAWGKELTPEATAALILNANMARTAKRQPAPMTSTDVTDYARSLGYNGPAPVLILDGKVLSCDNKDWAVFCEDCRTGKHANSIDKNRVLFMLPQYGCVVGISNGRLVSGQMNSDGSYSPYELYDVTDPWAGCAENALSKDDAALEFLIAANELLGSSFKLSDFGKPWGDADEHKLNPANS